MRNSKKNRNSKSIEFQPIIDVQAMYKFIVRYFEKYYTYILEINNDCIFIKYVVMTLESICFIA